ncbi:MAG: GntR family transcriptional regulator, N-acetylglucosamine utilization regulator [Thermomicrobiales bacterium]|jgi:GntR family transcriptional regulator|nr:GntR family transcriptional regulator, N-acetylglucosamine utilization regulator [Thermomicrobiales bacterium]MEA2584996.1 GntR family transcriptional regulator, N-acetylglucosamine utilization regulator [Thermomicrobiales bacterium]
MVESVKSGPLPRYYQLKEIIRERIRSGEWSPGSLIPSERELCERYGISRMTARQSITELANEGLLYREQGKGTYVGRPKIAQQLLRLTGFTEDMRAREQRPGAKVLTAEMWPADEATAERLRIKVGQPVYRLRRLRLADSEPLAVETSCISFMGCERLLEKDLERDSLYGLLEIVYDMPPMEAEQELEADLARDEEAGLLEVEVGSPILRTRRVTATRRNQPIEYATSIYRGDKYRFYTRMVRDQR